MQDKVIKLLIILIIWFSIYTSVVAYDDHNGVIESENLNNASSKVNYKNLFDYFF